MGYQTDFDGEFTISPPLRDEDRTFLTKLAETRRMKRTGLGKEFGVDGEFYVEGEGFHGQDRDKSIVDYNTPPRTQPGLWCQWTPTEDGSALVWDGSEKFYNYVEWLEYLIKSILAPRGYVLNGECQWLGEDPDDRGKIVVVKNKVKTLVAKITYEEQ